MLLPHFGWCLRLAFGAALLSAPLRAEPPAAPAPSGAEQQAVVVLTAAAGRDPELSVLLRELLERRGVRARISTQTGFDQAQLLHDSPPSGGVHVFVVPGVGGSVGLYFRAPDGERFLLRRVLLRAGFDDIGREQLGQILETAVTTLLHSAAGLTREQAQLALRQEPPDSAPTTPPPTAPAKPRTAPASPPKPKPELRGRATTLEGWFALRYGAGALGELGVAHGPGLELGLAVARGFLLRGRFSIERDFTQTVETPQVAAELSRVRLAVAIDAGLPFGERQLGQRLLASLGVGQDRVSVKPVAVASGVAPAPPFLDLAPVAHTELRYEAGSGSLRLALAAGVDAALVKTHYDVAHQNAHERVLKPWPVRPSASLALALSPRWATF